MDSLRHGRDVEKAIVDYLRKREISFLHSIEISVGEGISEIDFIFPEFRVVWEVKLTERENSTWQQKVHSNYADLRRFEYIRSVGRDEILEDLKRIVPPPI